MGLAACACAYFWCVCPWIINADVRVNYPMVCRARSNSDEMALSLALTIDDLALVCEEAYEARTKWHDLGLALRVPEDALESIESRCSRPKDGLREMLKAWLRRVEPEPTWAALVKALASKLVEEGPLAKGLEEKYCRDTASKWHLHVTLES